MFGKSDEFRLSDYLLPNAEDSDSLAAVKGLTAMGVGATTGGTIGDLIDHYGDKRLRRVINNSMFMMEPEGKELLAKYPILGDKSYGSVADRIRAAKKQLDPSNPLAGPLLSYKPDNRWFGRGSTPHSGHAELLDYLRKTRETRSAGKAITAAFSFPAMIGALLGSTIATPYLKRFYDKHTEALTKKSADADDFQDPTLAQKALGAASGAAIPSGVQLANLVAIILGSKKDPDRFFHFGHGAYYRHNETNNLLRQLAEKVKGKSHVRLATQSERLLFPYTPHFSPETRTVNLGAFNDLGIAAHELGHAEQPWLRLSHRTRPLGQRILGGALRGVTRILPMKMVGGSGIISGVTDSESTAMNAAHAATASTIPLIAEEIDASRRGMRIIREAMPEASLMKRLSAGKGLPSYLAMAAIPYASVWGRKRWGGGFSEE